MPHPVSSTVVPSGLNATAQDDVGVAGKVARQLPAAFQLPQPGSCDPCLLIRQQLAVGRERHLVERRWCAPSSPGPACPCSRPTESAGCRRRRRAVAGRRPRRRDSGPPSCARSAKRVPPPLLAQVPEKHHALFALRPPARLGGRERRQPSVGGERGRTDAGVGPSASLLGSPCRRRRDPSGAVCCPRRLPCRPSPPCRRPPRQDGSTVGSKSELQDARLVDLASATV